ncbi:MAG: signal peptidase I, partial [Flavobacteriales bacterium]|nr:signal peptidase I [Flavobacteriales bacterium]
SRDTLGSYSNVISIEPLSEPKDTRSDRIFPIDPGFIFNKDFYGPIVVPKAGMTIDLTVENFSLYERVITIYEGHSLRIEGSDILVDEQVVTSYTFDLDYYFMMGDNRDNSLDSRFWGFVPEDHIVGKAIFIWFSLDKMESWFSKIRWSRLFSTIE